MNDVSWDRQPHQSAAIQLTKGNAFQARPSAGAQHPDVYLLSIAEKYTAWVLRIPTRTERAADCGRREFLALHFRKSGRGQGDSWKDSEWRRVRLRDSLLLGIPNWIVYGGLGFVGTSTTKEEGRWRFNFFKSTAPVAVCGEGLRP